MNKSRLQFILLVLIFALPIVGGWVLILKPEFLPTASANKGVLLESRILLPDFALKTAINENGKSSAEHQNFWTLILIAKNSCNQNCIEKIKVLGNIRKALEEDYKKIKRLVIINQAQIPLRLEQMQKNNKDLGISRQDFSSIDYALLQFDLLVMDPKREIILGYNDTHNAKDILADLKRLLAVNRWGAGH